MSNPYTDEDVNYLYNTLGQAIWYLQHLENVMTIFNSLKMLQRKREKGTKITNDMAFKVLEKQRGQTLGPLINVAKKEKTIPKQLIKRFDEFLTERNWLVHKCVIEECLSLRNANSKAKLFKRIEQFVNESILLRREIDDLMKSWYVSSGYDIELAYSLAVQTLKKAENNEL